MQRQDASSLHGASPAQNWRNCFGTLFAVACGFISFYPSEKSAKNRILPLMPTPKNRWLINAEAAESLAVSKRTIKSWMTRQETREALGAVRHGKQWRVPRPENHFVWKIQTRARLKKFGICPPEAWERDLEKRAKEYGRYRLEAYRLWLAVTMNALERGSITQEARDAILLLWQTACEILALLPRHHEIEVDKLKSKFPAQLLARPLPEAEVRAAMDYWPEDQYVKKVRAAHTLGDLEAIRKRVDYLQATRELQQNGHKPTAENIRPLLHEDIMAHINDTRETLPPNTIKAHMPEVMRHVLEADSHHQMYSANPRRNTEGVDAQGRTYALVEGGGISCLDMRQPQDGLPLRTFRRRHPQRKNPQRDIVNLVYDVRESLPGAD